MTLHKLTAGDGYDYLSRQVARLDATETGHSSMHSYYTEKGERPGQWVGSGVSDLDGLNVGDIVQEAHMKSLFALGMHPLAAERLAAMPKGSTLAEMRSVQRLGKTYRTSGARSLFQLKVAEEIENIGTSGESSDIEREDLIASARTKIAIEMFTQQEGRAPLDQREIDGFIREHSRPANKAVAGYDLTFSPVKSVSSLWALADRKVARIIEDSHDAAVKAALDFIESKALYTRTGVDGVQQVETTGLIGVAFRHRDSRAGDPDLHTHVAIANKVKVRGQDKWLAIDGRIIFKVNVAASETYNTALERELSQRLGVRFAPREPVEGKRPVREIVGIPEKLNESWSVRTQRVDRHRDHLVREFSEKHGRPPTP
ncbi:MAG: relaxase domain-containing protein, partial [Actinomycetales bacterium]|nr:relaxase domain-containing protein [Actinomycetales bacterium]